jgi:hypothetical protein
MGERGPIPKKQAERRRRNKTDGAGQPNDVQTLVVDPDAMMDVSMVDAPAPDPDWHPLALMTYERVKRSAVRELYDHSDWALLLIACDQLSRHLKPQPIVVQSGLMAGQVVYVEVPMNGSSLAGITKVFSSLLMAEGDRRRLRIEVERRPGSAAATMEAPTGENVISIRRDRLG